MRENFARIALDDRGVQLLIDGERDKARKDALRAALRGIERPAAAQISAQVWLLDRSDVAPAAPQRRAGAGLAGLELRPGRRVALGVAETLKEKFRLLKRLKQSFRSFRSTLKFLDRASPAKRGQEQNAGYLAGLERETGRL